MERQQNQMQHQMQEEMQKLGVQNQIPLMQPMMPKKLCGNGVEMVWTYGSSGDLSLQCP